ncbi:MAG: succinylglutamate desuccinylase/aspartoacylase family protein [Proteobacteria bacterium]|nr:succinylglutamate desuccinylase/aspartoacylase family protein [Pseudomonadota bacterium]
MKPFEIGDRKIESGTRETVQLQVSTMANATPMSLPVHVVHGKEKGPVLFLSAVVHGDEILGLEIVRRVLAHKSLTTMAGTLLAIPIVNGYGFLTHSRYMPDRRDLNRSFPGSDHGSLASLLADLFFREVVKRSNYGIDLHTAALHRFNLPQIRISPNDKELLRLANAFAPPVVLTSKLRDGSLRQFAAEAGVKVLLYEGGEALRFDEEAIDTGTKGVLRVMHALGMVVKHAVGSPTEPTVHSTSSTWARAPEGGILHSRKHAGDRVGRREPIGVISDPLGTYSAPVFAEDDGIVIGHTNLPIVNRGDALFHIARIEGKTRAPLAALPDEDEII